MIGARMHYAVPRLLHDAGFLGRFYTDAYIGNKPVLRTLLKAISTRWRPAPIARFLGRRDVAIPPNLVTSFDWLGLRFALRLVCTRDKNESTEIVARRAAAFNRRVIGSIRHRPDAIWGFNGAAKELFQWAKPRGIPCVLEQTILPRPAEMRLLTEERERWPGWEPALVPFAKNDARAEREQAEWELADRIVGASSFVVEGLEQCGVEADRCRIVPYGVDTGSYLPRVPIRRCEDALRVLFVGEVGLRKGVPYLLEALRMLGPSGARARFVGPVALDRVVLARYSNVAEFMGPVPRSAVSALYHWADLLCLPSICEGSATVSYEALACAVPVMVTPNSGSLVRDGVDGFVVPIRDAEAIAERLQLYRTEPSLLREHKHGAAQSRHRVSIERYRRDLEALLSELL
jgi:hypothetical protein